MTIEQQRKYHRSFLGPEHFAALEAQRQRDLRWDSVGPPNRAPVMKPAPGSRSDSGRIHDAFLLQQHDLQPIVIEEKQGQNFYAYATLWERYWSRLSMAWPRRRFIPIVDRDMVVVGHCGVVTGKELFFIGDGAHGRPNDDLNDLLALGPVFVSTDQFYKQEKGQKYRPVNPPYPESNEFFQLDYYAVITDIDGQVIDAEWVKSQGSRAGAESVDFTPLGWFSIARDLVKTGLRVLITEIGVKGVRTIVRRVRTALQRRKKLPPPSPPRLPLAPAPRNIIVKPKHPRVQGEPDRAMPKIDQDREIHAANRYADRGDVSEIHLGDAARTHYKAPDGKFPDVVAKKTNGTFALSEGKGTDIRKMIEQFKAGKTRLDAELRKRPGAKPTDSAIISEQEVVVQKLAKQPVEGGVLRSPGPGYGVDGDGFLLDATGYVDLAAGLPPRVLVNGVPVKVIALETEGSIIGTTLTGGSRSPFPK